MRYVSRLPVTVAIEPRELERPPELVGRFYHVTAVPSRGAGALAYELCVPVDLAPVPGIDDEAPVAPGELAPIGSYAAPDGSGEALEAAVAFPGRDVHLFDFLDWRREREGFEVVEADPLELADRREAGAAIVRFESPARVSRFLLFRWREAIARVAATATAASYNRRADDFAVALSTFRFLAAGAEETSARARAFLEPFERVRSGGAKPLDFLAPASWTALERRDARWGRQVVDLAYPGDGARAETAFLRVQAIDRDLPHVPGDVEGLAEAALAEVRDVAGFKVGRELGRSSQPASDLAAAGFEASNVTLEVEGARAGTPAEARVSVGRTGRAAYCVAGCWPVRAKDPIAWMAARRASDLVLLSLNRELPEVEGPPPSAVAAGATVGSVPEEEANPVADDDAASDSPTSAWGSDEE